MCVRPDLKPSSAYTAHKCRCDRCTHWKSVWSKKQRYSDPEYYKQYLEKCRRAYHADPDKHKKQALRWQRRNPDSVKASRDRALKKSRERTKLKKIQEGSWCFIHERGTSVGYGKKGCRCTNCVAWKVNKNFKRRTHKRNAKGACSKEQLADRITYYGGLCYNPFSLPNHRESYEEIGHVIPLTRGGSNWPANLRPICRKCNRRKWNLTLNELNKDFIVGES